MIGDKSRGCKLEILLTKILLAKQKIQIVGMSATLPNLEVIANWLEAEMYVSTFRPVPLTEYYKIGNDIFNEKHVKERSISDDFYCNSADSEKVVPLVDEVLQKDAQVLIFCATKKFVENTSKMIATHLKKSTYYKSSLCLKRAEVVEEINQLPGGCPHMLSERIARGVAYHHAGLLATIRAIIEDAFSNGIINVLVATSTLAAGVNLPARRVIIRSPRVANHDMDVTKYRQMAGRAGRAGLDSMGECYLIGEHKQIKLVKSLISSTLPDVHSTLDIGSSGFGLASALTEVIACGSITHVSQLRNFLDKTLLMFQSDDKESICKLCEDTLKHLKSQDVVREVEVAPPKPEDSEDEDLVEYAHPVKLKPSQLADAIFMSGLSPDQGLYMYKAVRHAREEGMVLTNSLHLCMLITPIYVSLDPNWEIFHDVFNRLSESRKSVAIHVGLSPQELFYFRSNPPAYQSKDEKALLYRRFWMALILEKILNEEPFFKIANYFGIEQGKIQTLQETATSFSVQLKAFCSELRYDHLAPLLAHIAERLTFGVKPELLDLLKITDIKAFRARALYNAGYESVELIAEADVDDLVEILGEQTKFVKSRSKAEKKTRNRVLKKTCIRIKQEAQKLVARQIDELELAIENLEKESTKNLEEAFQVEQSS